MDNAQLINQTSGKTEYFTQPFIIEAARSTMGCIDLDPASCAAANGIVKASRFFDAMIDGLKQPWFGNVWLNHPFSRQGNPRWIQKAVSEFESGNAYQLTCITFAATSEEWTEPLFNFPICLLWPRTNYLIVGADGRLVETTDVTKGSMVTYMGQNVDQFVAKFSKFGKVMLPAGV